jgi:hypothetical protein
MKKEKKEFQKQEQTVLDQNTDTLNRWYCV